MDKRVDFSKNAPVYDCRHGALLASDAVDRLVSTIGPAANTKVLDVGAGTGRVAVPLVQRGFRVVAVDISEAMLLSLRTKAHGYHIPTIAADGTALPFRSSMFDAIVVARLLYLVPDWRRLLLEIQRVLKPGGQVIHEWGNGDGDEEWVQIREKARALFEQAGVQQPFHPGARREEDIDKFLASNGMCRTARIELASDVQMTLGQFVSRITTGECSYTWDVRPEVVRTCLPTLAAWAKAHFDLDRPIPFRITFTIYRA